MDYDLKEIRILRKKLGLTQSQLAKHANVSQSLIAKIESEKIDPTYSKAMQLINSLRNLTEKKDMKASDVMTRRVVTVESKDNVSNAISLMKKHKISQIPVLDKGACVGVISESTILEALLKGKATVVFEVMDETPPIVVRNSSISVISHLLKYYPLIVVADKGNSEGIIRKSDLINNLQAF